VSGFSTLGGITKLSQLTIDVAKDWLTYRIDNIGAPDSDDDALQRGLAILKALLTAQGQMIYASAPSTPASLDAPGSAMFLKHPGGAANPLWATVGGVLTWTKIFDGDTDTPTQVSWVARADMPNPPRTVHAGAAISGIMYNTAGDNGTAKLKDNDAYDPATNSWTAKTDMPDPARRSHAGAAISGIMYNTAGDENAGPMKDNDAYDPATNSWTAKTDMPDPARYLHAGAAISGIMYNTAGYGTAHLKDNDAYDPLAPWQLWSGSLNQGDIIIIDCVSALPFFAFARKFCGYSVFYCPSARSGNITLATDYSYKGVKIYRGVFS